MEQRTNEEEFLKLLISLKVCRKVSVHKPYAFAREFKREMLKYGIGLEAIIGVNGKIGIANPSHINALMGECGLTQDTAWDIIPIEDSPIEWLLEKSGCVAVWPNFYDAYSDLTKEQIETLDILSKEEVVNFDFKKSLYIDFKTVVDSINAVLEIELTTRSFVKLSCNGMEVYVTRCARHDVSYRTCYVCVEIRTKREETIVSIEGANALEEVLSYIENTKRDLGN